MLARIRIATGKRSHFAARGIVEREGDDPKPRRGDRSIARVDRSGTPNWLKIAFVNGVPHLSS